MSVLRKKDGKNLFIGDFFTEKEAAIAYNKVVKKEWGKYAYLNKFQ